MLWEHCSIPLLLELGFHGGLLNYWGKKKVSSILSNMVLGTWPHPISPPNQYSLSLQTLLELKFLYTVFAISFSYLPRPMRHPSKLLIYSFVLILQRIKKPQRIYLTPILAKFNVQKSPKHVPKTEVSEKLESVLQGGSLIQYSAPFFFKPVNCVENKPQ